MDCSDLQNDCDNFFSSLGHVVVPVVLPMSESFLFGFKSTVYDGVYQAQVMSISGFNLIFHPRGGVISGGEDMYLRRPGGVIPVVS